MRILLLVVLLGACAARPVRTAPFRERPDSTEAGDMRGPFSGRVTDAASGSPVADALVYATWTYEAGAGLPIPAGFREHVGSTDANGYYRIPSVSTLDPPGDGRLTDFTLVVYKRGYVGYRSDRRFGDFGPRLDFAQKQNIVLLERWRDDYSHARHLRYLGGGALVTAATSWETSAAIAELSGEKKGPGELLPGMGEGPYVVAAQLLSENDIKERTGYDGSFETGPLADEPDTATYSSQHFKALGRPETFDIALRVWRSDAAAALERYDELVASLPGVVEKDEIASRSLRASESEIRGVAFLDGPRGLVVLITCGRGQCASEEDAVALARIIDAKIERLWPLDQEQP